MQYVKAFDVKTSKRMPIADIRDEDAVYPGIKVFDLFFEGSKYTKYEDYKGPEKFEGLQPKNFGHWHYIFEKCLADTMQKKNEG